MQDPGTQHGEGEQDRTPSEIDGGADEDAPSSSGGQSPTPAEDADPQPF